ncbi:diheme cytochrome c [Thiolapillus sp.]
MNIARKLLIVISGILLLAGITACNHDDHEHGGESTYKYFTRLDVAPVENAQYREECGSCHFAYQPGLLPARSWQKMMSQLDDHFGENAELDEQSRVAITEYLINNAAEHSAYERSRMILSSLRENEIPLRISETRYFVRKHNELPKSVVQDNPKVGSFAACAACHVNADKGYYDEYEVRIPGYGKWDD